MNELLNAPIVTLDNLVPDGKSKAVKGLPFFNGKNAPEIKPIDWILPNILARGVGSFLSGQPGVSKSNHALVLAAQLCQGKPFAGMSVKRPYRILYCDFDSGWDWIGSYIKAAFRGAGFEGEGLHDNFYYWSHLTEQGVIKGVKQNLLEYIGEYITYTVQNEGIDIVIVDSLSMAMQGDVNKAQDITTALRNGLGGARAEGAAILVIDHLTKAYRGNEGLGLVPMTKGPQEKRAWGRAMITLEQEGDDRSKDVVTRWSTEKANAAHFVPFLTKLIFSNDQSDQPETIRLELVGEAATRNSKSFDQLENAVGQILQKLIDQGGEAKRGNFGYSGTVSRALESLVESGKIENHKHGFYRLKPFDHLTNP